MRAVNRSPESVRDDDTGSRHRGVGARGKSPGLRQSARIFGALMLIHAVEVGANPVWPALYLQVRLSTWWAVVLGSAIEYVFLRCAFGFAWRTALFGVVAMNLFSAIVGYFLLPFASGMVEQTIFWITNAESSFDPISWFGAFVTTVAVAAALEFLVLVRWFKLRRSWTNFGWLVVANSLSVSVALVTVFVEMPVVGGPV